MYILYFFYCPYNVFLCVRKGDEIYFVSFELCGNSDSVVLYLTSDSIYTIFCVIDALFAQLILHQNYS